MSDYRLVKSYQEVQKSVSNFNRDLGDSEVLKTLLSQFITWYYVPEFDAVGPSKFIGYHNMTIKKYTKFTSQEYIRQKGTSLDGRDTVRKLPRWFKELSDADPENALVRNKVEELLKRFDKRVKSGARFYVPKDWNLEDHTLSDAMLHNFRSKTANLPSTTEAERFVIQRVGQDIFRDDLLKYWDGRCAITGLGVPDLLRASHIKPWARCGTDAERLDVFNGLLLAPHLDAAFDSGFITVAKDGTVCVSDRLPSAARSVLGLDGPLNIHGLKPGHERYLPWHRSNIFQRARRRRS